MSDRYGLREIGGLQLAQHYPDRGLIADSSWYNAILHIETGADGFLGRLRSFEIATHRFGAVLSANADGLRIVVSLEQLTVFIPWSEATVSGERVMSATRICLRPKAAASLTLVFHLDDTAADDLFEKILSPLARRDPPRRLFRFKPWALGVLIIVLMVVAGSLASLQLSGILFVVMVVATAVLVGLGLLLLEPVLEDKLRPTMVRRSDAEPSERIGK